MRDLLSIERVANQIRLLRSTYSGSFLLVEGSSDKTFYERFVDKTACTLIVVSGKPSSKVRVIATLNILEKSNFQGVLAIVDADFDRLGTLTHSNPNLFRTDTHDLETMLINSPALDKVVAELGAEEKIAQFQRDIRLAILESGTSVGYLLWISQSTELNLSFDSISFSKFVDEQTLMIDEMKLIREVKNKSQAFALQDDDLQLQLTAQKSKFYDPWQVCCGHDLVEILSLGLRKAIGSNRATDIAPNNLERYLRLAYEETYFSTTQLYLDIRTWENDNPPFKVLRSDT